MALRNALGTSEYDFLHSRTHDLRNSVDLHGFYINILFIFSVLRQVCIGIKIANIVSKREDRAQFQGVEPGFFGRLAGLPQR